MRTASAALIAALKSSHRVKIEATILSAGLEYPVELVSGSVTLDQTAAVRGRCDIAIVDDGTLSLVPDSPTSLLAPYGNEIKLARGVLLPDGTSETVSLGVFRLQTAGVEDSAGGLLIPITGQDRASRIIDARFEEPYQVASGTNYGTAILAVLQLAYPEIESDFSATAYVTPKLIAQEGEDRWAFAQSMATSIGMSLFFDGDGVAVLIPQVLTDPAEEIVEGTDGVLLSAGRSWTREGSFNRVIAAGENSEIAPCRGVATDDNPLSPTYYYGNFGKVPRFYSSPFFTTNAQALAAAETLLNRELGTSEQVNFGSIVLPYLEPGDTVRISRVRAGIVQEDHILDQITIPLSASEGMVGSTRARQVI